MPIGAVAYETVSILLKAETKLSANNDPSAVPSAGAGATKIVVSPAFHLVLVYLPISLFYIANFSIHSH